jgi:hypothetical protein
MSTTLTILSVVAILGGPAIIALGGYFAGVAARIGATWNNPLPYAAAGLVIGGLAVLGLGALGLRP